MNEAEINQYFSETFDHVHMQLVEGNHFYFYDTERNFPFATLMTNDVNDNASDLNRPSVFRLNIGVSKASYLALFGAKMSRNESEVEQTYDFTILDQMLPHPVYGRMYWVCVLNPSEATFETQVKPLLTEAYQMSVRKHRGRCEQE